MKETNWWTVIGSGVFAAVAVLILHQFPEPLETALAIGITWGVGAYYIQKVGRKP